MAIEWKDATSYSQGQRGKKEPSSWECTVSGMRVWVSRGHIGYPESWVMMCRDVGIESPLYMGATDGVDPEQAQRAALTRAADEASRHAQKLMDFATAAQESTP